MLEYDRIDISEGIDVNKTNLSKECDICHYWYFKDIGFKYEPYFCNGCHDLMQKTMSFNNVAIVYVKGNVHRVNFWYMSKDDAINVMNSSSLYDRAKDYYENDKERLMEQARDKYRNLSKEEEEKKKNMGGIGTTICLEKKDKN